MKIKKTQYLGCSDEEFEALAKEILNTLRSTDNEDSMLDVIKNNLIAKYKESPLNGVVHYMIGEIIGKLELGQTLTELAELTFKEFNNVLEEDTTRVDTLLKSYKPKVVN